MAGADAVALCHVDTILHEPHGIFLTVIFDAAPILRAELAAQKCGTFRLRTLAHIEHRDPFRAAAAVARRIQRLVDDRLRNCAGREQLPRPLWLRHLVDRSAAAHVEEG